MRAEGLRGPWISVGAGYAHSCGLRAGGSIYCWGLNTENQSSPPKWEADGRARHWQVLSVGGFHGCGVDNFITYTVGAATTPLRVKSRLKLLVNPILIGRGGRRSSSQLWLEIKWRILCWGWNDLGQRARHLDLGLQATKQDNCPSCSIVGRPRQ